MKVITEPKELVGKEIVYMHQAEFSDTILIVTKDNCYFMSQFHMDEDEEIVSRVSRNEWKVLKFIDDNSFVRDALMELGILNIEEYIQEKKRRTMVAMELQEKKRREYEINELKRLAEKYKVKISGIEEL